MSSPRNAKLPRNPTGSRASRAQAMEKIVEGKLEKFYQTYCLVDQGFVKKNSEITVKEHVAQVAKQLGDEITIRRFVRFQIGESA